ncbi:MAG: carboxylesterase/lipase family protein [Acidimicrobiales bacterium]
MSETWVETTAGPIRGELTEGVHTFRGVPYGGPTGGLGRWRPPVPPAPWSEVRDATTFGPSCPQPAARPAGWAPEAVESEDCLVLNVWSAGLDGDHRPVMVWFHGGEFAIGSGSWAVYDGAHLARRGDAVVLTVNHRLGALGYLHLGELLGGEYASSGNVGMLDLVAALEWVRDNIARFGGDAGNVTIFGESGGGAKVSTLLAMPSAAGLFHRAVVQSGPSLGVRTVEQATDDAAKLLAELGLSVDGSADLREVPAEQIVAAQIAVSPGGGTGIGFSPVLDGVVVTDHPGSALRRGAAPDVPMLIGCTRDEATLFLAGDPAFTDPGRLDQAALERRLDRYGLGEDRDRVLAAYRRSHPDDSLLDIYIAIVSDQMMRVPSIKMAELKEAGGQAPVFMYLFEWAAGPLRSAHGFELPFVFDNVGGDVLDATPGRVRLAAEMSEAWLAFTRSGDPGHDAIPDWPAYDLDQRATMIFDRGGSRLEHDPRAADRLAWDGMAVRSITG